MAVSGPRAPRRQALSLQTARALKKTRVRCLLPSIQQVRCRSGDGSFRTCKGPWANRLDSENEAEIPQQNLPILPFIYFFDNLLISAKTLVRTDGQMFWLLTPASSWLRGRHGLQQGVTPKGSCALGWRPVPWELSHL